MPTAPLAAGLRWIDRLEKILIRLAEITFVVSIVGFIGIMLLTFLEVVLRFFFNLPIYGLYDVTRIVFAVTVSSAFGQTQVKKMHIIVDIFTDKLPPAKKRIVEGGNSLVSFIVFALISWQLFVNACTMAQTGEATETLMIPFAPFVGIIAFNLAIATGILLCQTIKDWKMSQGVMK